jgi:hypothetical protein
MSCVPILCFVSGEQVACFESIAATAEYVSKLLGTSYKRVYQRLLNAMNANQPYRNVLFVRVANDEQFSCFVNVNALTKALTSRSLRDSIPVYSISRTGEIEEFSSISNAASRLSVTAGAIHQAVDSVTKRSGYKTVSGRIWTARKDAAESFSRLLGNNK